MTENHPSTVKLKEFLVKKNGRSRRLTIELHKSPLGTAAAATENTLQGGQQQYTEKYYLRTTKRLLFKSIRRSKGVDGTTAMGKSSAEKNIRDLSVIQESPTASPARSAHTHITSNSGLSGGSTYGNDGEKWTTRSLVELKDANIVQVSGKKITLYLKGGKVSGDGEEEDSVSSMAIFGGHDGEKHFIFKDVTQAHEFETAILHYKRKEEEVQSKQLEEILNGGIKEPRQSRLVHPADRIIREESVDEGGHETEALINSDQQNMDIDMHQIENEHIKFLIEIVGCEDLPSADLLGSDPYVVAKFNNKTLHKTKHISKSLNPVYTLRNLSLFTWEIAAKDLFLCDAHAGGGFQLFVYDYDTVGGHDLLGIAAVPAKDLYRAKEERLTYTLGIPTASDNSDEIRGENGHISGQSPKSIKRIVKGIKHLTTPTPEQKGGTISIRCRRATEYDEDFMKTFAEYSKKRELTGILKKKEKEEKGLGKLGWKKKKRGEGGIGTFQSMLETKVRTFHDTNGNKIQKMKVMPGPDPTDSIGTEWMTEEEIEKAVMQPSRQFHYVGSGKIARVYLEILGCDDLPNMEAVTFLGNKTDAFVKVVYEDCICQTDVIDDKNSPRFLPWSKRAFVLHTNYPSSVINLGVFDYDPGTALLNDHDFIGRAAVDITNLRPGTEYMLNYALYDTALKTERRSEGIIKIRIRVEVDDPRAYLLASLSWPPTIYVNSSTSKNFDCVHQSCNGKYDMNKYSLATIIELLCELAEQGRITYYISDFIMGLFLWRNSFNFSISGKDLGIPLNSLCAFFMAITLVENPNLLPSYSFLTLGWLLTASMQWRIDHPNPWRRCPTFRELCLILFFGKQRSLSPEEIAAYEKAEEAKKYDKSWADLIAKAEKKAAEQAAEIAKEQEELYRELEEAGGANTDIASSTEGPGINPIKVARKHLYPIQQILLYVCEIVRFIRNIILWEESLYSFWVTFISFSLSVLLFFVPWGFIVRWSSRIVAWALFGPWMKAVDVYVYQSGSETEESLAKREEAERTIRKKVMEKTITETRIKNELLIKLRDFKQYFFGKFLTRVPILKYDRHIDQPLASSSAKPIKKVGATLAELALAEADKHAHREIGQHLTGLMIPRIAEIEEATKTGRAVLQQSLLEKNDPIGAAAKQSDSSPLASMKIGSVLLCAAVITYLAVPLLIEGVHYITSKILMRCFSYKL